MSDNREPVTADEADPGNADPELFTAALAPDDNVYGLIEQEQGDLREFTPVGEDPQQ